MIACLAAGLGSLLLMGCQSATSTSSASPTTPTTAPPDSGRTLPDGMAAEASAETVRHFNFVVKATGDAPANAVRQAVEGRLAAAGYKLNADAPDILVQIAVRSSEFDRSGGYLRYEGTSEAGVNRSWDNKRLGFDTVSVRGKRGLGADEAMRNLTSELSEGTAALVMNFARPEQSGLTAVDITVKRPWLKTHDPEYAQQFIRTVKQQPGVVYCALVPHDYDTKTLTFRIVHLADAMPEGVLNRLVSQRELGLKPRN
jgi:hypothetical protein